MRGKIIFPKQVRLDRQELRRRLRRLPEGGREHRDEVLGGEEGKTDQFRFYNINLICFLFLKSGDIDKCVRGVITSSGIAYDSDKKKDDAVGRLVEVVQGARSGLAKFGEPDSSLK